MVLLLRNHVKTPQHCHQPSGVSLEACISPGLPGALPQGKVAPLAGLSVWGPDRCSPDLRLGEGHCQLHAHHGGTSAAPTHWDSHPQQFSGRTTTHRGYGLETICQVIKPHAHFNLQEALQSFLENRWLRGPI